MTHEHDLPQTFADVQECATELYAILTGQVEADYIEIAAHAYRLLGFVLYVIGADRERDVIGDEGIAREATIQLTAKEQAAIDECLAACDCDERPVVSGPLAAWAIRLILAKAVDELLKLLNDLFRTKQSTNAIGGLGDGTFLKILLENLPLIIDAILKLLGR